VDERAVPPSVVKGALTEINVHRERKVEEGMRGQNNRSGAQVGMINLRTRAGAVLSQKEVRRGVRHEMSDLSIGGLASVPDECHLGCQHCSGG
jgi:hypothetical protein